MVLSAIFAFVFICEYLVSLREKTLPAEAKRKKKETANKRNGSFENNLNKSF